MKKCIVYVALAAVIGYAQAPDTLWTKIYGGTGNDGGCSVMQTSDGGYIIAGYTESFGAGMRDVWLLKTDASGDTLWTRTYGGSYNDGATDVQQTSDGGYIICGGYVSWSTFGWLIKTNSIGDTLWTILVDCDDFGDGFSSVKQTSDEGYIAAGTVGTHRCDFALLVKTDSLGNVVWDCTYEARSVACSVLPTADGCYVAAGGWDHHYYYFKTDSLGNTLWYNAYSVGEAHSIQQTPDGGFILAGRAEDELNEPSDIYLVRSNSVGNTLWIREYGALGDDEGNSIQHTADDGYIIAGYTESFGADNLDVWLLKTDASGDTLWTKTYGGAAEDVGHSVQQTADGGYIIAGYTESFGAGGSDIYLIKTEPDVGIVEGETGIVTQNDIITTIFRGPLQLPKGKKHKVYDITGRVVEPDKIQPGIYFIEIDGVVTQKVVKVR